MCGVAVRWGAGVGTHLLIIQDGLGDHQEFSVREFVQSVRAGSQRWQLFTSIEDNPEFVEVFLRHHFPAFSNAVVGGRNEDPALPVVSIGAHRLGIGFHADGLAWLKQLHGGQLLYLLPADFNFTSMSIDTQQESFLKPPSDWSITTKEHVFHVSTQCVLRAGDVLRIPKNWYYATENIGESIAVGALRRSLVDWRTGAPSRSF